MAKRKKPINSVIQAVLDKYVRISDLPENEVLAAAALRVGNGFVLILDDGTWTTSSTFGYTGDAYSPEPWRGVMAGYNTNAPSYVYLICGAGLISEEERERWNRWYRRARDRHNQKRAVLNLKEEARALGYDLHKR